MSSTRKRKLAGTTVFNDDDEVLSGSDNLTVEYQESGIEEYGENQFIVEKILGRKYVKQNDLTSDELFFVKWRGLSYLHVSWERREDIERVDPQGKVKIKRFFQSQLPPEVFGNQPNNNEISEEEDDIEYFPPDLVEIQRIIACDNALVSHSEMTLDDLENLSELDSSALTKEQLEEEGVKYLIKWRGLPYNECSWEIWGDLKPHFQEIWKFWNRQDPPNSKSLSTTKPSVQEYKRLETSPKFFPADCEDPDAALTLRDYQIEGVNWLLWNWWQSRPCILADEMGLGKTIQSVCFLHQLRTMPTTKLSGPYLVVAPLSLLHQWHSEVGTWSSKMNCVVMHGNTEARDIIQKHEFYFQEPYVSKATATQLRKSNVYKFDIMLTTYEVIMKEVRLLSKIPWRVLIIDEAHRLKNPQTRVFQDLSSLQYDHCVLLTGTPLQNKTEELWSLLHFADKKKFNSQSAFVSRFGDLRDAAHVAELHSVLKPYLLRRVKEDVEKSLPPKEETIIEVSLTPLQRQFYRAIYERNTSFLFKGTKPGNQPSLMNVMMELRKCCNHPYLIKGVEDRLLSEIPASDRVDDVVYKKLIDCSGKLVLLDKLLPRLYAEGHKVLIFSQMVRVLHILEDFLRFKNYSFERLDGNTRASERHSAVQKFCNNSLNRFVMLLSTKAGGLGLNLTSADTVIIFDSDWNPQNDIQAQARAHRIGQTRAVMVYRLLTSKTYEMHMFHRASLKLGLDRAVLAHARNEQDEEANPVASGGVGKTSMQAKEIEELLKRGAYDIFREDDSEQTDFVEADIDAIMSRRAHKVSYDNINKDALSTSLGGFSKASFISKENDEDIDIDDPEFWQKAVGLTASAAVGDDFSLDGAMAGISAQRRRKATQVYGRGELSDEEGNPLDGSDDKLVDGKPAKEVKDPKVWGPHSRDRIVKTLLAFGLGRTDKIRKEGGGMKYTTEEMAAFISSFVFQCGLCAAVDVTPEGIEKEPDCVRQAIANAKVLVTNAELSGTPLDIPVILQDEKFVQKLKLGVAKKNIIRLDLVRKAIAMVMTAVDSSYKDSSQKPADIDAAVAQLGVERIAPKVVVPDKLPTWVRASHPWWDRECSQHLLVGVFIYGFGNVNNLSIDTSLCFWKKIDAWNASHGIQSVRDGLSNAQAQNELHSDEVGIDETSLLPLASGKGCRITIKRGRLSSFRGVYCQQGSIRWIAQYGDAESNIYVGTFDSAEEAAKAYDSTVQELQLENAVCNYLPDGSRNPLATPLTGTDHPVADARETKYEGVRPAGNMWSAQRIQGSESRHLGLFCTELEAALAYDSCCQEDEAGAAAQLNFPLGFEQELENIMLTSSEETLRGVFVQLYDEDGFVVSTRGDASVVLDTPESLGNCAEGEKDEANVDTELGMDVDGQNDEGRDKEGHAEPVSAGPAAATLPDARFFNRMYAFLASYVPPVPKSAKGNRKNSRGTPGSEGRDPPGSTEKCKRCPSISEVTILSSFADIIDIEGIHLFHKKGGTKLCESILLLKQTTTEIFSNASSANADPLDADVYALDTPSPADAPSVAGSSTLSAATLGSTPSSSIDASMTAFFMSSIDIDSFPDPLLRRISSGLLLYAAPLDLENNLELNELSAAAWSALKRYFSNITQSVTKLGLVCADDFTSVDSQVAGHNHQSSISAIELQKYSWSTFCDHIGVDKSLADDLELFYKEVWLPFCFELSSKSAVFNLHKRLLPNPYKKAADHHLGARGLCHIFLRRQQIFHAIRYVLQHHLSELLSYLQDAAGRDISGNLPVWWCPWIHDVGVMVGCLRHGYMALDMIVEDDDLPFTRAAVERFVRKVFLSETGMIHSCGIPTGLFESFNEAEDWVASMSHVFPDKDILTARISRILVAFTASLPTNHPCYINVFETLGLTELSGGPESADSAGTLVLDGLCITREMLNSVKGIIMKRRRFAGPSDSVDSTGPYAEYQSARPVIPILSFIRDSQTRRKQYCEALRLSMGSNY